MKRILGLDLGVASIGWAVIDMPIENVTVTKIDIKGAGSFLINNSSDTLRDFQKGVGENANTHRRLLRSQRNRRHHAQRRRIKLYNFLKDNNMMPGTMEDNRMRLWQLRSLATTQKLELEDLGRVLIHLSKKRGHVSRTKVPDNLNIGVYVYQQLSRNPNFRAKGLEFSRPEHLRELETILLCQSEFYPEILTRENTYRLIHKIIFFDLRHKDKASTRRLCTLENKDYLTSSSSLTISEDDPKQPENSSTKKRGHKKYAPIAALRSNPLYQNFSTLCQLQHIKVYNNDGNQTPCRLLTLEEQIKLFNHLQANKYISLKEIPRFLGLGKDVYCRKIGPSTDLPFNVPFYQRKITGNQTYAELYNILGDKYAHLLDFHLPLTNQKNPSSYQSTPIYKKELVSCEPNTANTPSLSHFDDSILEQPLYKLWREIFSIRDKKVLAEVLKNKYGIQEKGILDKLCIVNFYSYGFSDTSIKSIRRLMPLMFQGISLEEACRRLGYVKSEEGIYTKANEKDMESEKLDDTKNISDQRNSICPSSNKRMRPLKADNITNPIVVKVLNKLVTLINKLLDHYGHFDSIHIELARELWMSASEREKYFTQNQRNQQDYLRYTKKLQTMGTLVSQKALEKFKIWEESDGCCIYCGSKIPLREYLMGQVGEIEHIIPRSMQFNDSYNNKACACRRCNQAKGSLTAYDYVMTQGDKTIKEYTSRIDGLYQKKRISKQKYENLTTKSTDLNDEFLSSQLVASRHIVSKSFEMLSEICSEVIPTNGIFTSFLRNKWGYDTILHDLNLPYYRALSRVEVRPLSQNGNNEEENKEDEKTQKKKQKGDVQNNNTKEKIQGWSKRLDHRNHAVDALVIALTSTDFIEGIYGMRPHRGISSDKLALSQPRPSVAKVREVMENIIVAHSPNDDKVRWSYRTNEFGQTRTLTPKCALHRESLYGEIQHIDSKEEKVKKCQMKVIRVPLKEIDSEKKAERIVDPRLKTLIKDHLSHIKATKSAKKEKEDVDSNPNSNPDINPPLYSDKASTQEVRYVRCYSYHQNMVPLRYDQNGKAISFVRTDNNHHLSIYRLPSGKYIEKVISFFDFAKLRRLGLKGVIIDSKSFKETLLVRNITLDEVLQKCIPPLGAEHVLTLMKNQLYILGMTDKQIAKAYKQGDMVLLSQHIYRVQGISESNYRFALHTQSETALKNFNQPDGRFKLFCSLSKFIETNPRRIIVDHLGRIKLV